MIEVEYTCPECECEFTVSVKPAKRAVICRDPENSQPPEPMTIWKYAECPSCGIAVDEARVLEMAKETLR